MNYCEKCGKDNTETALYCSACGANLSKAKETAKAEKRVFEKRIPIAALVLACCGLLCFLAFPAQIIALGLGVYGLRLNNGKSPLSVTAVCLSVIGILIFAATVFLIAANFDTVVGWEIFGLANKYIG